MLAALHNIQSQNMSVQVDLIETLEKDLLKWAKISFCVHSHCRVWLHEAWTSFTVGSADHLLITYTAMMSSCRAKVTRQQLWITTCIYLCTEKYRVRWQEAQLISMHQQLLSNFNISLVVLTSLSYGPHLSIPTVFFLFKLLLFVKKAPFLDYYCYQPVTSNY